MFRRTKLFTVIALVVLMVFLFVANIVSAWDTNQKAESECTSRGIVIHVEFSNKESVKHEDGYNDMDVVAQAAGESKNLGTVRAGETATGTIRVDGESLSSGKVKFVLTWTNREGKPDTKNAKYEAVEECLPDTPGEPNDPPSSNNPPPPPDDYAPFMGCEVVVSGLGFPLDTPVYFFYDGVSVVNDANGPIPLSYIKQDAWDSSRHFYNVPLNMVGGPFEVRVGGPGYTHFVIYNTLGENGYLVCNEYQSVTSAEASGEVELPCPVCEAYLCEQFAFGGEVAEILVIRYSYGLPKMMIIGWNTDLNLEGGDYYENENGSFALYHHLQTSDGNTIMEIAAERGIEITEYYGACSVCSGTYGHQVVNGVTHYYYGIGSTPYDLQLAIAEVEGLDYNQDFYQIEKMANVITKKWEVDAYNGVTYGWYSAVEEE